MKSMNQLLDRAAKIANEESSTPSFSAQQKQVWAKVWAMLEASRLVTEPVTSSTSLYWMSQTIDAPPERLLKATQQLTHDHTGYQETPVLQHQPADREVAKKYIAEMRKTLGI